MPSDDREKRQSKRERAELKRCILLAYQARYDIHATKDACKNTRSRENAAREEAWKCSC